MESVMKKASHLIQYKHLQSRLVIPERLSDRPDFKYWAGSQTITLAKLLGYLPDLLYQVMREFYATIYSGLKGFK